MTGASESVHHVLMGVYNETRYSLSASNIHDTMYICVICILSICIFDGALSVQISDKLFGNRASKILYDQWKFQDFSTSAHNADNQIVCQKMHVN